MFANHKTTVNQNQEIYSLFKLLRKMFANHKTTVNQNLTLLTVMMAVACDFHSGRSGRSRHDLGSHSDRALSAVGHLQMSRRQLVMNFKFCL